MDTLNRLKQQEREVRKNLIIDAARRVFGEKTFDAVSMAEIARRAGIAKSSIYTYFDNQEALFVEIAFRDTQQFTEKLAQIIDNANPEAVLRAVIDQWVQYYTEHETHWRMITRFALQGQIGNEAGSKLNLVARHLLDLFDRIWIKMGHTGDNRLLSHSLFSTLSGILIAFKKYPGRTDAERLAHMKRIGRHMEAIFSAYLSGPSGTSIQERIP